MQVKIKEFQSSLTRKIDEISGTNVMKCYQCGKCSAGCPVVDHMDLLPNQIIRMAQIGKIDELSNSNTPWVCAACLTCTVRCPRGIKIAEVMEAIREITLRPRNGVRHLEVNPQEAAHLPPIALISAYRKVAN